MDKLNWLIPNARRASQFACHEPLSLLFMVYLPYIYKLSKTWEITYYTSMTLFLWLFYVSILHML